MLNVPRLATMVAAFQGIYYCAHFASSVFAPKYRTLSVAEQNLWCQFTCSFIKGTVLCCLIYPMVWANFAAFRSVTSLDGAVNGTGMEFPLYWFTGYAISDTVSLVRFYAKGDKAMVIHHVATMLTWCYLLHLDFGHDLAAIACLVEFTTPLLALRWFMATLGAKDHPLYVVNGLVILLSWWALRVGVYVVWFGVKSFSIIANGRLRLPRDAPIVAAWLVGSALQLLWAKKLTVGFAKVVREMTGGTKKSVEAKDE